MKTPPEKKIILTFHSYPHKDAGLRWKANVIFPSGADDETLAEISIVDGHGNKIEAGEFEFAGMMVKISSGSGAFRCADFISGKHEAALWLHRPGLVPVPGMLTFE
jgi:hypothetical protein